MRGYRRRLRGRRGQDRTLQGRNRPLCPRSPRDRQTLLRASPREGSGATLDDAGRYVRSQNEPTSLRAGNVVLSCSVGNHAGWRGLPGGAEGIRTLGLCSAITALSQLSYSPVRGPVLRENNTHLSVRTPPYSLGPWRCRSRRRQGGRPHVCCLWRRCESSRLGRADGCGNDLCRWWFCETPAPNI